MDQMIVMGIDSSANIIESRLFGIITIILKCTGLRISKRGDNRRNYQSTVLHLIFLFISLSIFYRTIVLITYVSLRSFTNQSSTLDLSSSCVFDFIYISWSIQGCISIVCLFRWQRCNDIFDRFVKNMVSDSVSELRIRFSNFG